MKGQSLIEALVALSMVGIILAGITVIVIASLSNAQFSKNQNLATGHAQDGLEIIRQIRDRDYSLFKTRSGSFCLGENATDLQSACSSPNIGTVFLRTVQIVHNPPLPDCGPDTAKATVVVSWNDSKCQSASNYYCHKSELISCLSTVNPIQAL